MTEETKEQIQVVLDLLRQACINNGVSMAFDPVNDEIMFFDTAIYVDLHKFSGFKVKMLDLVR